MFREWIQGVWEWLARTATAPVRVYELGGHANMNDWVTLVITFVVILGLGIMVSKR
jgi:uncharacterized membrane protein (DUF2068 family)